MIRFMLGIFGFGSNTTEETECSLQCTIRWYMMLICSVKSDDVNFDYLSKVVSARILHNQIPIPPPLVRNKHPSEYAL